MKQLHQTFASIAFSILVMQAVLLTGNIQLRLDNINNNLIFQTQKLSDWRVENARNSMATSTISISTVKTVTRRTPNPLLLQSIISGIGAFLFMREFLNALSKRKS